MDVRGATEEEIRAITSDPLTPLSAERYALEWGGKVGGYLGVSTPSPLSHIGFPWFRLIDATLCTRRDMARLSKAAVRFWGERYSELRVAVREGELEGWFRFLGFVLDTRFPPLYIDGEKIIYLRYTDGLK